jgi:hypothetical protein
MLGMEAQKLAPPTFYVFYVLKKNSLFCGEYPTKLSKSFLYNHGLKP